jgi:apolipoprotein N-acyltransferase
VIGLVRRDWLLIGVGAVLLALSYPPFPLPVLSFVALVPALLLIRQSEVEVAAGADLRGALRRGFWFGLCSSALVLYWMIVALWHFTPLSALGYIATITALGVFSALTFWLVVRIRRRFPGLPLWLVFPVVWTAVEWAVGHLGDVRFPWLGLGTSLTETPVVVQWADIAGARGVTLWVAWVNVMVLDALKSAGSREPLIRRITVVAVTVVVALGYGMWRERTLPVRDVGTVTLIQPNVGFREKWEAGRAERIFGQLVRMSRQADSAAKADLIIWPEAAIPGVLSVRPEWDSVLSRLGVESGSELLVGAIDADFFPDGAYISYNAAHFVDSTGKRTAYPAYYKHYLVPITERVPFLPARWFQRPNRPAWLRWFSSQGVGTTLPVYPSGIGGIGVIICYESAFEDLPRAYRRRGADFLVNITNDAWFGRTSAPYQHAAHLVMRAIETRMGVARAANSGVSAFVDPLGGVHRPTEIYVEAAVTGTLTTSDARTLYVRLGDWVGLLVVSATMLLGAWTFVKRP